MEPENALRTGQFRPVSRCAWVTLGLSCIIKGTSAPSTTEPYLYARDHKVCTMIIRSFVWALALELLHIVTAVQPSAPSPISAPLRELPWAQLNFLHTTDTHGWHAGHLQEYCASSSGASIDG